MKARQESTTDMPTPKLAEISAAHMAHRSYRRGLASLMDDDLVRLSNCYPDLREVFEEVQYLREVEDWTDATTGHV